MISEEKVTLVTGGTGGLGSRIVSHLMASGHHVIINYRSNDEKAKEIKRAEGVNCEIFRADMSKMEDVVRLASFIRKRYGKLNNLINNAGVIRDGLLIKYPESDWDHVMDCNLKSVFLSSRELVPIIKGTGGGHILNISSYSGLKGKAGQIAYSAAKAGVIGLGMQLAAELGRFNIRVNTVIPGYMDTGMGKSASGAMADARAESLMDTLSDPDEVAALIVYLCETSRVTGQLFSLDSRIL